MKRGAWPATVHGVAKRTGLGHTHTHRKEGGNTRNRTWKMRIVRASGVWETGEKACIFMSDGDSRPLEDTGPSQAQVK